MPNKVLVAGCGYLGTNVARILISKGYQVEAITRTNRVDQELIDNGLHYSNINLDIPESIPEYSGEYSAIYYFVPPPKTGFIDIRIRNFLSKLNAVEFGKFILVSTTGVYGDCKGEWVTESRTPIPTATRAKRRLDAEHALTEWCTSKNVEFTILRVPGIYGPGKLPIQRIIDHIPVLKENQSPWSNRIHIVDLVNICISCIDKGENEIFNVSDGNPSTMTDYFNTIADVFGLQRPPQIDIDEAKKIFSQNLLSYFSESRRISNRKMLEILKVSLKYPLIREGLKACKESMTD